MDNLLHFSTHTLEHHWHTLDLQVSTVPSTSLKFLHTALYPIVILSTCKKKKCSPSVLTAVSLVFNKGSQTTQGHSTVTRKLRVCARARVCMFVCVRARVRSKLEKAIMILLQYCSQKQLPSAKLSAAGGTRERTPGTRPKVLSGCQPELLPVHLVTE